MAVTTTGKKYFTGARAIFYYNGQVIGFARGISGTEEYTMEPINVLGQIETIDYAPTSYRVTFRCRFFRLVDSSIPELKDDSSGIFPNKNLTSIFDRIGENVQVDIYDMDGKNIMTLTNVIPVSRSWDVDSRGVWGEDITFNAIYCIRK